MIKLRQNRYYLSLNTLEIKSSNKELCALFLGSNTLPATLQHVDMTVIYNSECTNRWSSVSGVAINDQHICIFEEPKSACNVRYISVFDNHFQI